MNYQATLATPIGELAIEASESHVLRVFFTDTTGNTLATLSSNTVCERAKAQLKAYFQGQRMEFDLPLAPLGTDFQRSVWQQLTQLPYAHTASYGDVAQRLQNPKACRAVGMANRANPIAIIVPCHRVIGANQTLTGYAGGLERKAWLLKHEQRHNLGTQHT